MNDKVVFIKRLIADSFDLMSIFILFMLFTYLLMNTPLANTYKQHQERYIEIEREVIEESKDLDLAKETLNNNNEYKDELFAANLHSYLIKVLSCLLAEMIILLLIPLFNNNSTLGKKLVGLRLFNESRQTYITYKEVVIRFIFIFVESVVLYPWTGIYTFLLMGILRLIVMLLNKKHKTICDYLCSSILIEEENYNLII